MAAYSNQQLGGAALLFALISVTAAPAVAQTALSPWVTVSGDRGQRVGRAAARAAGLPVNPFRIAPFPITVTAHNPRLLPTPSGRHSHALWRRPGRHEPQQPIVWHPGRELVVRRSFASEHLLAALPARHNDRSYSNSPHRVPAAMELSPRTSTPTSAWPHSRPRTSSPSPARSRPAASASRSSASAPTATPAPTANPPAWSS